MAKERDRSMILKKRWVAILKDILEGEAYGTKLMAKYHISDRTLRNDLKEIDYYLIENQLPCLVRTKDKGIQLEISDLVKQQLWQQIEAMDTQDYVLNPEERLNYIFFLLLLRDEPISADYIANQMGFSRNTVVEDLKRFEKRWQEDWFKGSSHSYSQENKVQLVKKRKVGMYLELTELQRRQLYMELLTRYFNIGQLKFNGGQITGFDDGIHPIIRETLDQLFADMDMYGLNEKLEWIEKALKIKYSDVSINIFKLAVAFSKARSLTGHEINLPMFQFQTLKLSKEYKLLSDLSQEGFWPEHHHERAYLAMYLLSNKILEREGDFLFEEKIQGLVEITEHMIEIFENEMELVLSFEERDKLFKGLILHLEPAVYRMRYNICISNKLLEEIKARYPKYYDIAGKACMYLSQRLHIIVPEEEIGFIALYFGGIMESQQGDKIKILLICHAGLATVRILEKQLLERFENIEIIGSMSHSEYQKQKHLAADLVISTVDITWRDVVVVNPLLDKEDIEKLKVYLSEKVIPHRASEVNMQGIMKTIEKYAKVYAKEALEKELTQLLQCENREAKSLSELLDEDNVFLNQEVAHWEDAVRLGTQALLKKGIIEPAYEAKVIENIKRYKAYVVVKKGVAMPHAKAENGANGLGISLITLKKGIEFGHPKNDPVSLVLIFANKDGVSHLRVVESFLNIIKKESQIQALLACEDLTALKACIQKWEDS